MRVRARVRAKVNDLAEGVAQRELVVAEEARLDVAVGGEA